MCKITISCHGNQKIMITFIYARKELALYMKGKKFLRFLTLSSYYGLKFPNTFNDWLQRTEHYKTLRNRYKVTMNPWKNQNSEKIGHPNMSKKC